MKLVFQSKNYDHENILIQLSVQPLRQSNQKVDNRFLLQWQAGVLIKILCQILFIYTYQACY